MRRPRCMRQTLPAHRPLLRCKGWVVFPSRVGWPPAVDQRHCNGLGQRRSRGVWADPRARTILHWGEQCSRCADAAQTFPPHKCGSLSRAELAVPHGRPPLTSSAVPLGNGLGWRQERGVWADSRARPMSMWRVSGIILDCSLDSFSVQGLGCSREQGWSGAAGPPAIDWRHSAVGG